MSLRRSLCLCKRGLRLPATVRSTNAAISILTTHPARLCGVRGSHPLNRPLSVTAQIRREESSVPPSQQPPRAVIFDLGGVIVPSPQPIFDSFELKYNLEPGSLVKTIKVKGEHGAFAKMERGQLAIEEFCEPFHKEYAEVAGAELTLEQTQEFMGCLSDFTKLRPHPEIVESIEWLKSQGIKIAVLTNNFRWLSGKTVFPREPIAGVDEVGIILLYPHVHTIHVHACAHTHTHTHTHMYTHVHTQVVQSCLVGLRKPDKAIFDHTLEKLGVSAREAVFLDDLGGNLKTAREMGMATIMVSISSKTSDKGWDSLSH